MIVDKTNVRTTALYDKVAVITGAGQGIGKETARILAHLGARVIIAELNDTGREVEQQICDEGGRARYVKTDVSDVASMKRLHWHVANTFGPVDVLVNNAEANFMGALLDHALEDWDHVLEVNLRGAFFGIKEFLPEMLQRKAGVVVTFESAEGMPYMGAYLASKVGLRSLALSLAQEIGAESGVSVYCFGAGMVDTPGSKLAFQQLAPLYHLTLDQFIRQSAPGGQLISAELCATGLVGTLLFAPDFHGQGDVHYILGLSKLGLDPQGDPWETAPIAVSAPSIEANNQSGDERRLRLEAVELNHQMEAIVRTNIKEYDELSMFQRPVVKRMFQQGTGLKVEDWLTSAQAMTQQLGDSGPVETSKLETYIAQLKRMAAYITKQERDAQGWIKDPAQLKVTLQALEERKETVLKLSAVLTEMGDSQKS